ncbi:MAG: type II toxin-antitoxin system RelE/ParE family toxin [Bacteroidota bacterium]
MEYSLEIFPEAEAAMNEAVVKLEKGKAGRGSDLLVAISEALEFIAKFPKGSEVRYRSFRVKPIKGFSYLLIYEIIDIGNTDQKLIAIEDFVHQSSNWLLT